MKKTLLVLVCIITVLTALFFGSVSANAATYDYLTYEVNNGEVTITGAVDEIRGNVIIPDTIDGYPVTVIGARAFFYKNGIESVEIPEGVTTIEDYAFYSCDSLTTVKFPSSLKTIGDNIFYDCEVTTVFLEDIASWCGVSGDFFGLFSNVEQIYVNGELTTELIIPDGVTTINNNVFRGCDVFTKLVIPPSVTDIGAWAFSGCVGLEGVYISDLVAWCNINFSDYSANPLYCAQNLYLNNELITDLVIPEEIKELKDYVFFGATCFSSVHFPENLSSISSLPFSDSKNLKDIYIPDLVHWCTEIESELGASYFVFAEKLYIDNQLVSDLVIPEGVTRIRKGAFTRCPAIKSVTLPDSLNTIEQEVFGGCKNLKDVYVSSIDVWVDLERVHGGTHVPFDHVENLYVNNKLVEEYVYSGTSNTSIDLMKGLKSIKTLRIADDIKDIPYECFRDWAHLETVVFSNSVNYIGTRAFYGCSGLKMISIPDSVTSVGEGVFQSCGSLEDVSIGNGLTALGVRMFAGCSSLCNIELTSKISKIGANAFSYCGSLEEIDIPVSVTSIEEFAFSKCISLKRIIIPNSVKTLGGSILSGCESLEYAVLPDDLTQIPTAMFSSCSSLKNIVIPETVTHLGLSAFSGCRALEGISLPQSLKSIDRYTFSGCVSLLDIVIPEGIAQLPQYVFNECKNLKCVAIPKSVTVIDEYAFLNCDSIECIYYSGTVDELYEMNVKSNNDSLGNALAYCGVEPIIDLEYTVTDGKATITGYNDTLPNYAAIMYSVDGYPIEAIGEEAFKDNLELEQIFLSSGINRIYNKAFYNCDKLIYATLSEGTKNIGSYAFAECERLTLFELPRGFEILEDHAFYNSTYLTAVMVPDSLKSIGDSAFGNCSYMMYVLYEGNEEEWRSVVIGEGNEFLSEATCYFDCDRTKQDGWHQEGDDWYYFEGGIMIKNDWRLDSIGWSFLGSDGKLVKNGFVKDSVGLAYLGEDGYFYDDLSGWIICNGIWYYLENGYAVVNDWRKDSAGWCFLDGEGKWVLDAFIRDSVGLAYITKDGYFYYNTTGWIDYHGTWYYVENGYAVTNEWRADSKGWCYLSETGAMVTSGFVKDGVGLAYITADGYFYYTETGWRLVDDQWYFVENGYAVMNGWRLDSIGWCYLGENGPMLTNVWIKDSIGWCWLDESGYWNGIYYDAPAV